ncbi:c2h2 finger domain-containing protein [Dactylonectria estremocensis]|uniref:C2h2 finger domain-containing protein n=1 Tax=Dactylonectria estremocensis TaxID=1079267 RepID=A0A9P9F3G3_9HYPO|nr:c2h2 finger domain-containing protein [Dactylonectria estremocensis]
MKENEELSEGDVISADRDFDPSQCLFCNNSSLDLDNNLAHMLKTHGLFIPEKDRLVVDMETFITYLHLVIFGYFECLCCGSQRYSAEAVQQHMTGKGHCKFNLYEEGSEFRDFYNFHSGSGSDSEDTGESQSRQEGAEKGVGIGVNGPTEKNRRFVVPPSGDPSLRLPSGKLLSHRSSPKPHNTQRKALDKVAPPTGPSIETDAAQADADLAASSSSKALTRAERRDTTFANNQLMRLRAEDRRSLMHLPTSEQRAVLAVQKKQLEKARRAERTMRTRVETLGNKSLMMHFVPDTPGRSNG